MESAPCDGGGVVLELRGGTTALSYYGRLSSAAGRAVISWPSSRIIAGVASGLFSLVFRQPLPALLAPAGTNHMAKFLQANRIAFCKTLDETANFAGRISASQIPTLQSNVCHFSLDQCPLGEPAVRVSELAIDEELKSGAFSLFTTGQVASPIIPMKRNKRKLSMSPHSLFFRSSSSCSHLQEPHSYPQSSAKLSFLSSLPFSGRSFSENHLDHLPKEFSLSRRWYHTSKSGTQCWSCGKAGASWPFLVCEACGSVQPMDPSVDYFQIFGLERAYEIKDNNLEGKYKDWQKKLHPDLVHSKSEKERAFAAEQSARVIDAYRTLSKPLSRALYLLQLEGVHVDEEKTLTDPEILVEMMEIRETVEEAADSDTLKQIQPQIQNKLDKCSSSFREAFEERNFKDAITSVQRMRYYDRAIEAIVKKL